MVNLLCMPREQVQGRLHNIISSVAMIYGLVFSGVAGSALSPLDVEDFEVDTTERHLANFFNMAASFQFMIAMCGTLFTTYLIMEINFEPESTIFRCVANMDFFCLYAMLIFWSTFILIAQLCTIVYMRCDFLWAWATIGGVLLIFYLLLCHWAIGMKVAFPNAMLHYFPILAMQGVCPHWLFGSAWKQHVDLAKHLANIKLQDAATNFGESVVSAVRREVAQEGAHANTTASRVAPATTHAADNFDASGEKGKELQEMLVAALPHSTPEHIHFIVTGMIIEEFDLAILVATARRNPVVLNAALTDNNMRFQLRTGERLALIEALSQLASSSEHGGREEVSRFRSEVAARTMP